MHLSWHIASLPALCRCAVLQELQNQVVRTVAFLQLHADTWRFMQREGHRRQEVGTGGRVLRAGWCDHEWCQAAAPHPQ